MGAQAGATFPHVPVSDGFELKVWQSFDPCAGDARAIRRKASALW